MQQGLTAWLGKEQLASANHLVSQGTNSSHNAVPKEGGSWPAKYRSD